MKKGLKLFSVLLSIVLIILSLPSCSSDDPNTDEWFQKGNFYVWNGVSWVQIDTNGGGGGGGSAWYDGAGVPAVGLGVNGDYYLNDTNGDVYAKAGGAWGVVGNILGPTGATGPNTVTGTTSTSFTGYLTGNGANVGNLPFYEFPLTISLADHEYSGVHVTLTAGENLAIGDVCYKEADGKYWKAKADVSTTVPACAMATGTISTDATGVFLLLGYLHDDSWSAMTVGARQWTSATTAGAFTGTAPTGSGKQNQIVGIGEASKIIYFKPDWTVIELK